MFEVGKKVIDLKTNEIAIIYSKCHQFYLIKYKNDITVGRFSWELDEYNIIKSLLRKVGIKNGRK